MVQLQGAPREEVATCYFNKVLNRCDPNQNCLGSISPEVDALLNVPSRPVGRIIEKFLNTGYNTKQIN